MHKRWGALQILKSDHLANSTIYSTTNSRCAVFFSKAYPGWKPEPQSPICSIVQGCYKQMTGSYPNLVALHAGLEVCVGYNYLFYYPAAESHLGCFSLFVVLVQSMNRCDIFVPLVWNSYEAYTGNGCSVIWSNNNWCPFAGWKSPCSISWTILGAHITCFGKNGWAEGMRTGFMLGWPRFLLTYVSVHQKIVGHLRYTYCFCAIE